MDLTFKELSRRFHRWRFLLDGCLGRERMCRRVPDSSYHRWYERSSLGTRRAFLQAVFRTHWTRLCATIATAVSLVVINYVLKILRVENLAEKYCHCVVLGYTDKLRNFSTDLEIFFRDFVGTNELIDKGLEPSAKAGKSNRSTGYRSALAEQKIATASLYCIQLHAERKIFLSEKKHKKL